MNTKLTQSWNRLDSTFRLLFVVVLVLGIAFRFAFLAERPYWHDETYTLLRSSGYTIAEMTAQIFDGRLLDRSELLKFQQISPDKNSLDMLRSFVAEVPHRAPLYYAIARTWMIWFGNDVAVMRSLSVLISLVIFPALHWLCTELSIPPLTGWIAMMLVAVSPFHLHYAQEVREYSLWTVSILLMSAAFLRAIRLQTKYAWGLYTLSTVLSFYTSILSVPVAVGQIVYFAVLPNFKYAQKIRVFLKAFLLGFLLYLPWLSFTFINLSQVEKNSEWMFHPTSIQILLTDWVTNFQFAFLQENLTGSLKFVFATAIALLVILATKSLIKFTPKTTWLFVVLLILPSFFGLAVPDLVWGGLRSTNERFFVPCYLGMQLTVAHFLATRMELHSKPRQQTYWKFVMLVILTTGVLSCSAQVLQNQISQDKSVAKLVNRSNNAIVISNEVSSEGGGTIGDILAIAHLVRPETKFQLVIQPQVPSIPSQPDLYLFKPLNYLKQQIRQSYPIQTLYKDQLFRILPARQ